MRTCTPIWGDNLFQRCLSRFIQDDNLRCCDFDHAVEEEAGSRRKNEREMEKIPKMFPQKMCWKVGQQSSVENSENSTEAKRRFFCAFCLTL